MEGARIRHIHDPAQGPARATILVIDDDANLLKLLERSLGASGYAVVTAVDGRDGMRAVYGTQPDLVILDLMMPHMDGWEVLARVREMTDVPVIVVSGRDDQPSRLRSFELGADDFVAKPFSLAELSARVKAVLDRTNRSPRRASEQSLTMGDVVIDRSARKVYKRGADVNLSPTAYRMLMVLAEEPGRAVSHEELLQRAWGAEYTDNTSYIKRYVWFLRQALEDDPSNPRLLESVRGFGYRLAPAEGASSRQDDSLSSTSGGEPSLGRPELGDA